MQYQALQCLSHVFNHVLTSTWLMGALRRFLSTAAMISSNLCAASSETNNQKIPKFKNKGAKGKMNEKSVVFTTNFKNPQFFRRRQPFSIR